MKTKITFDNPATECAVVCGDSVFEEAITPHIEGNHPESSHSQVFAIVDRNAYHHHSSGLLKSLSNRAEIHIFPPGEEHKHYENALKLMEWLLAAGADRNSLIIGIGGGVVTDIAGYVAATFMRGVSFLAVPTTLVGQVDAAIGGKTAVNLDQTKNIVGAFHFPSAVICDTRFLQTLEPKQIRDGLVEAYKILAAHDRVGWQEEAPHLPGYLSDRCLTPLIEKAAALKCAVVSQDPFEQNIRKVLNFGHTAGHAIEAETGCSHGHAVAIGILVALELSISLAGLAKGEAADLAAHFRQIYSELPKGDLTPEPLWSRIQRDKKKRGSEINFVLLKSCGEHIVKAVDYQLFSEAFEQAAASLSA